MISIKSRTNPSCLFTWFRLQVLVVCIRYVERRRSSIVLHRPSCDSVARSPLHSGAAVVLRSVDVGRLFLPRTDWPRSRGGLTVSVTRDFVYCFACSSVVLFSFSTGGYFAFVREQIRSSRSEGREGCVAGDEGGGRISGDEGVVCRDKSENVSCFILCHCPVTGL